MRKYFITLLSTGLSCSMAHSMDRTQAMTNLANADSAYVHSEYLKADSLYRSVETDWNSFELQFNLGNTSYRLGKTGQAILHFERARKIRPFDEDVKVNLEIANARVADKIEPLPSLGVDDLWKNLTSEDAMKWWSVMALALVFLGSALLGWFLWYRRRGASRILLFAGICVLAVSAICHSMGAVSSRRVHSNTEAVVMTVKIDVRTSPTQDSGLAFVLHEGTKVTIRSESDDWLEIRIANGSVGWIPRDALVII